MAKVLFTNRVRRRRSERFTAALRAAGVARLADVRAVAASRKRGFSKTALAAGLAEAGIGYTHLRGLGTPKAGARRPAPMMPG